MKKVALQYLRKHSPLRSKVRDGCHDLDISQETGPNKRKAIEEMNNSKNSQTPKRFIEHKTKKQSVANIRIIVPMTVPIFVCSIFLPYSLSTSIFNYWFVLFFHNKTFVSMSIKKKNRLIFIPFSLQTCKSGICSCHISTKKYIQISIWNIFPI